jgi:predicted transcriptional regulator
MGLAAKSSMKDGFFDDLSSTQHLESILLLLTNAFFQLAKTRLTDKQQLLLFTANRTLHYHPHLSPTRLADYLARKLNLPLSTTKFNLKVLKTAGLLETHSSNKGRTIICLSYGGQILTQIHSQINTK